MILIAFGILNNNNGIKNHQNGLISIKDSDDVNISHSKWDFIFLDPVLNDCKVYFIG